MVDVPNDFSGLQQHLFDTGQIDRAFWVVLPDHLSYFTPAGLRNLAEATGWHVAKVIGDQPIDLNLLNPATNYVMDRARRQRRPPRPPGPGQFPAAHGHAACRGGLLRSLAGVGLGRSIVAFFSRVSIS